MSVVSVNNRKERPAVERGISGRSRGEGRRGLRGGRWDPPFPLPLAQISRRSSVSKSGGHELSIFYCLVWYLSFVEYDETFFFTTKYLSGISFFEKVACIVFLCSFIDSFLRVLYPDGFHYFFHWSFPNAFPRFNERPFAIAGVVHEVPRIGSDGESEEASGASDEVTSPVNVKLRQKNRRITQEVGIFLLLFSSFSLMFSW